MSSQQLYERIKANFFTDKRLFNNSAAARHRQLCRTWCGMQEGSEQWMDAEADRMRIIAFTDLKWAYSDLEMGCYMDVLISKEFMRRWVERASRTLDQAFQEPQRWKARFSAVAYFTAWHWGIRDSSNYLVPFAEPKVVSQVFAKADGDFNVAHQYMLCYARLFAWASFWCKKRGQLCYPASAKCSSNGNDNRHFESRVAGWIASTSPKDFASCLEFINQTHTLGYREHVQQYNIQQTQSFLEADNHPASRCRPAGPIVNQQPCTAALFWFGFTSLDFFTLDNAILSHCSRCATILRRERAIVISDSESDSEMEAEEQMQVVGQQPVQNSPFDLEFQGLLEASIDARLAQLAHSPSYQQQDNEQMVAQAMIDGRMETVALSREQQNDLASEALGEHLSEQLGVQFMVRGHVDNPVYAAIKGIFDSIIASIAVWKRNTGQHGIPVEHAMPFDNFGLESYAFSAQVHRGTANAQVLADLIKGLRCTHARCSGRGGRGRGGR